MISWILALKRTLKPTAILMFAIVLLTVWAGGQFGDRTSLRPCGVVCEDPEAQAVADALAGKGFLPYETRRKMADDISRGVLDCGAVLLPGLADSIATGEPKGHVLLLTAPDSFLTEVYEAHISASIYTASAPVLTVQSAQEAGVKLWIEEVKEVLQGYYDGGYRFTFDIQTTEGKAPEASNMGKMIARAAAALLLFAAIVPGTIRIAQDAERMYKPLGRKNALLYVLLPMLTWQTVLYLIAVCTADFGDTPALIVYSLALTALGLALSRLPFRAGVLLPILLLGSLAMFPIYYDLAAVFPSLMILRFLLPPCWFLLTLNHFWLCLPLVLLPALFFTDLLPDNVKKRMEMYRKKWLIRTERE